MMSLTDSVFMFGMHHAGRRVRATHLLPSQSEYLVAACPSGLCPEVSFKARERTGGAPLAPIPIWKRGAVAARTWARGPGSVAGLSSADTAFGLGRAAVSEAAPAA